MHDEVTGLDSLVAMFLNGVREALFPPIAPKGNLPVPKASDDLIVIPCGFLSLN